MIVLNSVLTGSQSIKLIGDEVKEGTVPFYSSTVYSYTAIN